jgi:asparagine synthase (glutamine-hydrolysing)
MCGIAGLVNPNLGVDGIKAKIRRMTDAILHRGPDENGCFAIAGRGIGMTRLSIIDVAGGSQPIINETNDIAIVCNGEIYNHGELREMLIAKGHRFRTKSDCETALHIYEEEGVAGFQKLRGMFGLAILDTRQGVIVLARDRLGKKPLFYSHQGENLCFGSEIKSLLAACPELREPDYRKLPEFLQSGYLYEPDTIYKSIKKLPAGHYAIFRNNCLDIQSFWTLRFEVREKLSEAEWIERLDAQLLDAVKARLESEVPLGVFLSGGIDSSLVAAFANRAGLKPLKTFTIGFDNAQWDESADARRIAEHIGSEHHELRLSVDELQRSLPETLVKLVHYFDEPFGDDSALPTYHVSKLARQHVTVILSGDGGDELFAGYSSYQGAMFAERYKQLLPHWLGGGLVPNAVGVMASVMPGKLRYKLQRIERILRHSSLPLREGYRQKTSIWNVEELRGLLNADVLADNRSLTTDYLPRELTAIMNSNRDVISRLTEMDVRSYMRDDILVKVDRMSMAHSLEVRSPLLDQFVVEMAAAIPSELKLKNGVGKYILKKVVAPYLPAESMKKRKQGFGVPLRDWLKGGLAGMVSDYLEGAQPHLPGDVFQLGTVQKIVREHRQGERDHSRKLWLLLVLAAWFDQEKRAGANS